MRSRCRYGTWLKRRTRLLILLVASPGIVPSGIGQGFSSW